MGTALSVLVDATLITFVFALAALGLAVVFGLIGVINMGHGAMLTLGAYFTWFTTTSGVPFLPSVLLAAAGVAVIGLALEHFVIRHFYDRPFETLLLTWGFFLIATEMIKIIFGTDLRTVENPLPGAFDLRLVVLPAYQSVVRWSRFASSSRLPYSFSSPAWASRSGRSCRTRRLRACSAWT